MTQTAGSNGDNNTASSDTVLLQLEPSDDDEFYMQRMADILDAFPKSGPPKHPVRLSDHLYIGNQENADDLDLLSALGITHVLNMAGTRNFDLTRSPYKPNVGVKAFLMIPAEDYDEYDIIQYFVDAMAFLGRAKSTGGQALVHCNYGVNRSGAVAAAYLMISERKPLLEVVQLLKAKRSLVLGNVGFRRQLIRFARCRGFLDAVERKRSLRSSASGARLDRLDVGEDVRSASHSRAVTPVKTNGAENGKELEETKVDSNGTSLGEADEEMRAKYHKATALYGKTASEMKNGYHNGYNNNGNHNGYHTNGYQNGYRNGYDHKVDGDSNGDVYLTAVTTMNGYNNRERLLRDIDDVIANISQKNEQRQKTNGFSLNNGYHDDFLKPALITRELVESSPERGDFDAISSTTSASRYLEDRDAGNEITTSTAYPTLTMPSAVDLHGVDDYYPTSSTTSFDREYSVSSLDSSSSYVPFASRILDTESNGILDEYYEYKNAAASTCSLPPRAMSAALASANDFVSAVKPRSHYYHPTVAKSSAIDDYDQADINSYLAESDARRAAAATAASSRSSVSLRSRRNVSVPSFDDVVAQALSSARRFSTPGSFSSALQSLYQPAYPTSSTSARSYSSSSHHQSNVGKPSAGRSLLSEISRSSLLPPSGLSAASTRRSLSCQRPHSGYSTYGSTYSSTRGAGGLYNGDSCLAGGSAAFSTGQPVRTRVTSAPGLAAPRRSYAILQDFDW